MKDVVVTGFAWRTALGQAVDNVWEQLNAGKSGSRYIETDLVLRNDRAAIVPGFGEMSPQRRLREIARSAIADALLDAEIDTTTFCEIYRAGSVFLVLGTSHGARLDDEEAGQALPDDYVQELAEEFKAVPIAISTACSSGSDTIAVGAELVRAGIADLCICGAVDIVTRSKLLAHSALGTMSPTDLSSFDADADGTILGEGAGVLILEPAHRVGTRGHRGFIRGCGSANDAAGLTAPDTSGRGVKLAVERSLADAGFGSDEIGIINAHGSGTPTNDQMEARAYSSIFRGLNAPTIFATKGAFGHSLGATGALEAIATLIALAKGTVPPVIGHRTTRDDLTLPIAYGNPVQHNARIGLSVTVGFGGFNTALIFEKPNAGELS